MSDSTLTYLDAYCERAGEAHIWAEPVNALTNLAFLIAAWLALKAWRTTVGMSWRNSWDVGLLIILLASIGLGSGAWHLFADSHTLLMDVIPILLFMNVYIAAGAVRLLGYRWKGALAMLALFHAMNFASEIVLPRDVLNGSIMYAPALMMLLLFGLLLRRKASPLARQLWQAAALFVISLTFRTVDLPLCGLAPLGTHFLWHLLNAALLYLLLRALIAVLPVKKH